MHHLPLPTMASQTTSLPSPPTPPPAASPSEYGQSDLITPAASQQSLPPTSDPVSPSSTGQRHPRGQHPKGKRNRTSPADKAVLVKAYSEKPQPSQEEIAEITSRVSMNKQAVRIWFQNRRQNDRRKARPLSPQLIESITQGRISVSRFGELPEHTPFNSGGFPGSSQTMSPPEQRTSSSAHSDGASCRSDGTPGSLRGAVHERGSISFEGRELAPSEGHPTPAPSWPLSGQPGYLSNRRNTAGAPPLPSSSSRRDSFRSEPFSSSCPLPPSSSAGHDAFDWKPSSQPSQFRLSTSMSGQAEITTESPPRPSQILAPVEPLPWPEIPGPSELRRSASSASLSRRAPGLKRSRSSNVQVWEDCANSETREDPLIAQAKHESSGSAIAEISLLRSLSAAGSPALEQASSTNRAKRRSHHMATSSDARYTISKRPRLERSWSTNARIETTSALAQRHNTQPSRLVPAHPADKPKPTNGLDHLSLLASESDKENLSPDEDGNPRPYRRTLSTGNVISSTSSGRRRLPSGPPSSKPTFANRNPRRTPQHQQHQQPPHPRTTSLARAATSPSSWSAYSKQYRTNNAINRRRSPAKSRGTASPRIYEDGDGSGDEGNSVDGRTRDRFLERDDVHRFMTAGDVSPSKKKEVDAAANLIALKFAR
ncbi:uncharacterized protein B0H64DRAFT_5875 [Chaetomium fimeti]|uniref:Homeobox domain-containing protein n=1 Tax=Chaetomium fimeti TaxID=1854472 RepID=A0AAE0HNY8_9PEZI|nr:hypothetical protein B0H64DRAFT_5875 [Chaetomium fimeti]